MAYSVCASMFVFWVFLISLASSARVYDCEPGTEPTLCIVNNLVYTPEQDPLPLVNRSDTVKRVQLNYERFHYQQKALLNVYDVVLHETVLRSPPNVAVINYQLHTLVMPRDLEVGDFLNNIIKVVDTDPAQSYNLRYLDLSHNSLDDLRNLSVLVNLQTLRLERNEIVEIKPETFARMINLSILTLGYNHIVKIDLKVLPKRLIMLSLRRNSLTEIVFGSVSFVSMRELDLESNQLTAIDVASMMRACPSLQLLPIEFNPISKDEAQRIITELDQHNVSYYIDGGNANDLDSSCDSDEYQIDRMCFSTSVLGPKTFLKAFVLILVGIVLLGLFGLSARWIWHEMRY
ncbi:protein flightless-1-like [Anopheles darlingi]|uniref:protein flightless-1-like n=1 Tax=Anopheles darlingi TaxID=43151 RepID=UPI00210009C6|nr:protein flightless-1-like [Anopheles darlingi]